MCETRNSYLLYIRLKILNPILYFLFILYHFLEEITRKNNLLKERELLNLRWNSITKKNVLDENMMDPSVSGAVNKKNSRLFFQ